MLTFAVQHYTETKESVVCTLKNKSIEMKIQKGISWCTKCQGNPKNNVSVMMELHRDVEKAALFLCMMEVGMQHMRRFMDLLQILRL